MSDHPDVYADAVSVSANPFGVTLTLTRSEPGLESGPEVPPSEIVGRVRMSHELARALAQIIQQTLAQAAQAQGSQGSPQVKH